MEDQEIAIRIIKLMAQEFYQFLPENRIKAIINLLTVKAPLADLRKAIYYIQEEINNREKEFHNEAHGSKQA